jgi:pSer/pThr/pTyr-binding forkhead associated (FHA) protein
MTKTRRIHLFLVHQETGQRYPLTEAEVIIGRSSGDLLYPEDFKLSPQHCRVFTTPMGLAVHDLRSAHGTWLDGVKLDPRQVYVFKAGSLLRLGDQILKLQESSFVKRVSSRRSSRPHEKRSTDSSLGFAFILCCLMILAYWQRERRQERTPRTVAQPVISPYDRVNRELETVLDDYKLAASVFNKGTLQDTEIARQIRGRLLPALEGAQSKLSIVKPGSEYERRHIELDQKLLTALGNHLKAYANLVETKNRKYGKAMETFAAESERIKRQLNRLEGARAPSSQVK